MNLILLGVLFNPWDLSTTFNNCWLRHWLLRCYAVTPCQVHMGCINNCHSHIVFALNRLRCAALPRYRRRPTTTLVCLGLSQTLFGREMMRNDETESGIANRICFNSTLHHTACSSCVVALIFAWLEAREQLNAHKYT